MKNIGPRPQGHMLGMKLPGNSTVEPGWYPIPEPGYGQVLLRIRAASLCGSDLKYIYHAHHTGSEDGAQYDNSYLDVIAGHEPSGEVAKIGPGVSTLQPGDRVTVYHISGCGLCDECRKGYMIGCTSKKRRAYGWQRDGALAEYMLAEANTCLKLPEFLTCEDGAMIACGFGTAYQALLRANVSGRDTVLVTGLGPVGQAAVILAKAMGAMVIGADVEASRMEMGIRVGADHVVKSDDALIQNVNALTGGKGVHVAIDCSGNAAARHLCLEAARLWGNVVFVGEMGSVTFEPSPLLLHKQLTLHGSWVTSLSNMDNLIALLDRKRIHPSQIVTHRFPLEQADEAFAIFATGKTGKVVVTMDDPAGSGANMDNLI